MTYNLGEDGEKPTLQFSTPLNDNLVAQVNKVMEEMRNGGRENIERSLNESLRYYGIETGVPSGDDLATEDGESSSEEDLPDLASPVRDPSNQDESDTTKGFSKSAVQTWFKLS